MADDALSTIQFPSWRGIPFPLTSLECGFTQEHVEHKFIYRDGMHIETTGRNGFNFLGRIPFNNGVQPGDFEPWAGLLLFPTLFRRFLEACRDGSAGEFVHPDFGPIQCKARDVTWRYTSNLRDGVEITVRWYETVDSVDQADALTQGSSPAAAAERSASVLDSELDVFGPVPELENDTDSFSDMVTDYNSGNGGLGRIQSKLDSTDAALARLDDVANWPLQQASFDMRSSLVTLGQSPGQFQGTPGSSRTREYVVPFGTPLGTLGIRLGVTSDQLVSMNPRLARSPYVPAGTRVRYSP